MANIVLLAHAVIPHHHHENEVCIASLSCEDEHEIDSQENHKHCAIHDYEHNDHKDVENCTLRNIEYLSSRNSKHECNCGIYFNHNHEFNDFQTVLFDIDFYQYSFYVVSKIPIPESSNFYINFVNTSLSLRAPPVV